MPVTLEESEGKCILRLEGEVNITSAAEMKRVLLQALASGTEILVDLERAAELDVTVLQLLLVLQRDARVSGRTIGLVGAVPEDVRTALAHAGFEKFPIPIHIDVEPKGA